MVDEEEGTDNREYCRECGWCSEEPYTEGCVKWQEESREGNTSNSFWHNYVQLIRNFVFGKCTDGKK